MLLVIDYEILLKNLSSDSVGSVRTATKLLHIRPYKITVVPEIKPVEFEKKSHFL
jgi:hypothetical protein